MGLGFPLQFIPEYREYVWGGSRLRPGQQTAEAWVVYSNNQVAAGPLAGRRLGDLAAEFGPALLGGPVFARSGGRFPILIKLLDCAEWLSLQVHPNDEQAREIEGEHYSGKTEAWHILEADSGAELIAGVQPGTTPAQLEEAVRDGQVLDLAQYHPVHPGDTILMPAGTIHALGPGLLIYELQQESDLTYRVFDWDRGREVHIEKSLAVANPEAGTRVDPLPALEEGRPSELVKSPYFRLQTVASNGRAFSLDTRGESFHALTVIAGQAEIQVGGENLGVGRFESVLVPADCKAYQVRPKGPFRALLASA